MKYLSLLLVLFLFGCKDDPVSPTSYPSLTGDWELHTSLFPQLDSMLLRSDTETGLIKGRINDDIILDGQQKKDSVELRCEVVQLKLLFRGLYQSNATMEGILVITDTISGNQHSGDWTAAKL